MNLSSFKTHFLKQGFRVLSQVFIIGYIFTICPVPVSALLKTKRLMPEFLSVPAWINSEGLKREDLKGNIAVVYFWNYSCIPCQEVTRRLNKWYKKFDSEGVKIVGIHVPEFEFEKDAARVGLAVKKSKIKYPVALDPESNLNNLYEVREKPTMYLIDWDGNIRYTWTGTGDYPERQKLLLELLRQQGKDPEVKPEKPEKGLNESEIKSPPMYLGYVRLSQLGNQGSAKADLAQVFKLPEVLSLNYFYLTGKWKFQRESLVLISAPSTLRVLYHASKFFLIAGSQSQSALRGEVLFDGAPLTKDNKGKDVVIQKDKSFVLVKDYQPYELVDMSGYYGDHNVEIRFEESGLEAYAIDFR